MTNERISFIIVYVKKRYAMQKLFGKEDRPMDEEKRKALQELLKILSDCPEVAERITITIRPDKPKQSKPQSK